MYTFFIFLTLNLLRDNNYVLKVWDKNDYAVLQALQDHKFQWQHEFKISTFLHVAAVTLPLCHFKFLRWASSDNTMNFFCLVNQFTIFRLFIFLWRYRKMQGLKKTIMIKINNIKKQRCNLFIFQKTEPNWILNIYSICNCSDHLFSVSYGYLLSFMSDLTFPQIFS